MGISQEEFRQRFNKYSGRSYTSAAISQIDKGKRYPKISSLIDFADFHNVSVDYLIEHDNYQAGVMLTDEQYKFLNELESLDVEGKRLFAVH